MPDMNENAETQQEYFGRANASRMSVEEREKTILLQQLSDREKRIAELEEENQRLSNLVASYMTGEEE